MSVSKNLKAIPDAADFFLGEDNNRPMDWDWLKAFPKR